MLAAERRQRIADLVRHQRVVQVKDLCLCFGASESTVRRDLAYLERQGILERSYGGAAAIEGEADTAPVPPGAPFSEEEERIALAASQLISPGETVFLGPGTGPLAVAHALSSARIAGFTVVTNALDVATHLTAHTHVPVILTGGQVDRGTNALYGHLAQATLEGLRAGRAIVSAGGIQLPDGFTSDSLAEAELLGTVFDMASEVTVVLTAEKWGRAAAAFLAPLEAADSIVTSRNAPPNMVWDLTELGIHVIQT